MLAGLGLQEVHGGMTWYDCAHGGWVCVCVQCSWIYLVTRSCVSGMQDVGVGV